ncbi:hypothetical protein E4O05_09145 [Treponema sp. OMZ 787]|uniref:pectate lyase-like adhesive domain-containing protein n=1 Tax=Treponema sp. OMZ 787 TaxID=2563669 RepID=UPI0020A2999D|nr:pectate lyase-like adhesive domain-containing protein [Treponema sp. OMZ 787]UTC61708.1 hypothetical protein E4O05_09145 [Treponema sp. OMZ 787]
MRKKLLLIEVISLVILAGCEQFLRDIEKDFEYWASTVIVTDTVIPSAGTDADGYPCIKSDGDKEILIKIINPKNYRLQFPGDPGAPSDIAVFASGAIGSVHGTDYTLSPNGHGELKLTLKEAFLKKNEHGKADLNPSIKLYSTDGRNFGTHSFKLRVNTPPPKADYKGCGKKDNVYVLVFEVPNMPEYPIEGTDRLHSDVDKVWIQKGHGASFEHPITLNGTTGFNPPESQGALPFCLIKRDGTAALTSGDVEGVSLPAYPSHGSWLLYLKTDTPLKSGKTDYKVRIKDKKGLYSGEVTLSTPGNTIAPVTVNLDTSTGTNTNSSNLSDENTSDAAYLITAKSSQNNVQLTMSTSTTTASLICEVKKVSSDETVFSSTVSNPITVNLPVPTDSYEETYKVIITATDPNLPQTVKTIYYKVRGRTITVKTWKDLKEAVNNTEIDTIKVTTTITAAASGDNSGEIKVNRNSNKTVTIKGSGTIDADDQNRIFLVENGNTLILNNLTLQNGNHNLGGGGGAVRVNDGGNLIINDVIIKDCKAVSGNGGGISSRGHFTMRGNSSITNCNAVRGGAVYIVNGDFSMNDYAMITPSTGIDANTPGRNDVYLSDNKKISMDIPLFQSGIVARITPQTYDAGTQVLAGSGLAAGYEKFIVTDEIASGSTQSWTINELGKLQKIVGGNLSLSPNAKWVVLKDAVESAEDGDVLYIEGEYQMSGSGDTIGGLASCTIKGKNNTVLNIDNQGSAFGINGSSTIRTLENLEIKNGKDDEFVLSADSGGEFHLKNVSVTYTKNIISSNSGDITFENVTALDSGSVIKLGGMDSMYGGGEFFYCYLNLKGNISLGGTIKLTFDSNTDVYRGAIKICDKKAYNLRLDFGNGYNTAEGEAVVFLDPSVAGYTLAQAVANITVKDFGGSSWYIDDEGKLQKRH